MGQEEQRTVSLSGTFETLSVSDVFGLLASGHKTGALHLDAGSAHLVLHVVDGQCAGLTWKSRPEGGADDGDVAGRVRDAVFEIMKSDDGHFAFDADADDFESPSGDRVDLRVVAGEVRDLLEEWHEIEVVVPSLDHRPRLDDALESETVEFDRERWTLMVAADGRRSVRDLARRLDRPVLDLCRELVTLVDIGVLAIDRPSKAHALAEAAGTANIVPEEPYGPGVGDAVSTPPPAPSTPSSPPKAPPPAEMVDDDTGDAGVVAEAVDALRARGELPADLDAADPRDRGALLRLFSALRDT
jgi:hypothetical protein